MYGSVTCLINKKDFKNQHMVLQPKVPWIFFIYLLLLLNDPNEYTLYETNQRNSKSFSFIIK